MLNKRIRKDAGQISIDDLRTHSSWEFCLDEEGVEGQTEATTRPYKGPRSKLSASDPCQVACTFSAANGRSFIGWISLGSGNLGSLWHLNPEIFLPRIPEPFAEDPRLFQLPNLVAKLPARGTVNLCLPDPRRFSPEKIRPILDFAYNVMEIQPSELFPLSVSPNQTVIAWPNHVSINGFISQPGRSDQPFIQ